MLPLQRKIQISMRYIFIILALWCCSISGMAQTDSTEVRKPMYSVRHGFVSEREQKEMEELEAFRQRHLYLAGEAVQKSTFYLAGSMASAVVGGVLMGTASQVNSDGGVKAMFISGGIMAITSFACLATTIHFHNKAGRELRLSAGEVIYKF